MLVYTQSVCLDCRPLNRCVNSLILALESSYLKQQTTATLAPPKNVSFNMFDDLEQTRETEHSGTQMNSWFTNTHTHTNTHTQTSLMDLLWSILFVLGHWMIAMALPANTGPQKAGEYSGAPCGNVILQNRRTSPQSRDTSHREGDAGPQSGGLSFPPEITSLWLRDGLPIKWQKEKRVKG